MSTVSQWLRDAYEGYLVLMEEKAEKDLALQERKVCIKRLSEAGLKITWEAGDEKSASDEAKRFSKDVANSESEHKKLQAALKEAHKTDAESSDEEISVIRDKTNEQIRQVENERDNAIHELEQRKQAKLAEIRLDYDRRSDALESESDLLKGKSEYELAALNFYQEELSVNTLSDGMVSDEQNKISSADTEADAAIAQLLNERNRVTSEFAPDIEINQKQISAIIDEFTNAVASAEQTHKIELDMMAQNAEDARAVLNSIEESYEEDIAGLRMNAKEVEREYNAKIRQAEAENRGTTKLMQSKNSRLSKIQDSIVRSQRNKEREIQKHINEAEKIRERDEKKVTAALRELEAVLARRDNKLRPFQNRLSELVGSRDRQVAAIDRSIQDFDINRRAGNAACRLEIDKIENNRSVQLQDITNRATQFALSNQNSFDGIYGAALDEFSFLDDRLEEFRGYAAKAAKMCPEFIIKSKKELYKKQIDAMDYESVLGLANTTRIPKKPLKFPSWQIALGVIVGIAVAATAIIIFSIGNAALGIALALLIIGGAGFGYYKLTNGFVEGTIISVYFAENYRELQAIKQHAVNLTAGVESSKLRDCGINVYNEFMASNRALQELSAECERRMREAEENTASEVKSLRGEFHAKRERLNAHEQRAIKEIYDRLEAAGADMKRMREDIERKLGEAYDRLEDDRRRLDVVLELVSYEKKISDLEKSARKYAELQKELLTSVRSTSTDEDCVLPNTLYIGGAQNNYADGTCHMAEFTHDMKTTVVLFEQPKTSKSIVQEYSEVFANVFEWFECNTDLGLTKRQFLIDIQGSSGVFKNNSKYEELGLEVVYADMLDEKAREIAEEVNENARLQSSGGHTTHGELNEARVEIGASSKPYIILHIIVPMRDQLTNDSKLLTTSFRTLLTNDSDKNCILPIFYVCDKEFEAKPDDDKKQDDVIFFIKDYLGKKVNEKVYKINNETKLVEKA